jgi:WD40 repeat protein
MKNLILIFLIILFAVSCAELNIIKNYTPLEFQLIQEIELEFTPEKCIYSNVDKTIFIWQKDTNLIHIFKNGMRINTVGGAGSERSNLSQLSDIALSPDGNLFALDSFQKKIKKYDRDGMYITSFDLQEFKEPVLLAVAVDETFYIYDDFLNEIIATRDFIENNWFNFGSQVIENPLGLSVTLDQIIIYEVDSTIIFNTLGQLENHYNESYLVDKNQLYSFKGNSIQHESSEKKFTFSTKLWQSFSINNSIIILTAENHILIGKFIYEVN